MTEKNKKINIFTKNLKSENYIIVGVGIISIIIGVLIFLGFINPEAYKDSFLVPIICVLMGIVASVYGICMIIKDKKYKNGVYYKLLDDYSSKRIEEKIDSKVDCSFKITKEKANIEVIAYNITGNVTLNVNEKEVHFDVVLNEDEEFDEGCFFDSLQISLEEVYLKLSTLINLYLK